MNGDHQITKRELVEMLAPHDDDARVEIRYKEKDKKDEDGRPEESRLFVDSVRTVNNARTGIVINAYEA